jgi:hypothetical protein
VSKKLTTDYFRRQAPRFINMVAYCRRLPPDIFLCRDDLQMRRTVMGRGRGIRNWRAEAGGMPTPPGIASLLGSRLARSGGRLANFCQNSQQAKGACADKLLLSILEQMDFQESSIGVNADGTIAVGPQHRYATPFQPIEDLCMRMAKRTVLGD